LFRNPRVTIQEAFEFVRVMTTYRCWVHKTKETGKRHVSRMDIVTFCASAIGI